MFAECDQDGQRALVEAHVQDLGNFVHYPPVKMNNINKPDDGRLLVSYSSESPRFPLKYISPTRCR